MGNQFSQEEEKSKDNLKELFDLRKKKEEVLLLLLIEDYLFHLLKKKILMIMKLNLL